MNMQSVLFEVAKERGRQDAKWGGSTHDDRHTTKEFARFIDIRADRIGIFLHVNPEANGTTKLAYRGETPRSLLVEIAALAVAAVESIDRKQPPSEVEKLMDAAGLCRRCAAQADEQPNTNSPTTTV